MLNFDFITYTFDLLEDTQIIGNINLNSHVQLKSALSRVGINVDNTQEATLLNWFTTHPKHKNKDVLGEIIEYKKCLKRVSFAYDKYVNPVTNRIHTDYAQAKTVTGRFASSKPNLQNVLSTQEYRSLFVARDGYMFAISDYSQQEMRILAHLAQDDVLREVCLTSDVHLENAHLFYNDITITKDDIRRRYAKAAGFAMAYGASAEAVAETAGIPIEQARIIVSACKKLYKKSEIWAKEQLTHVEMYGWVSTLSGRRRRFIPGAEGGNWSTEARNTPVQGTAADMLKLAMVYIDKRLREQDNGSGLVLTTHDELVVEFPKSCEEETVAIVRDGMEKAGKYYIPDIPMPVDIHVNKNWGKQ